VFNMPFRQFAESMRSSGIDIGITYSDMDILFTNADSSDGIIRIKPVDAGIIERILKASSEAKRAA
jgi:hypothetical protein